jgi:hypothetical protein
MTKTIEIDPDDFYSEAIQDAMPKVIDDLNGDEAVLILHEDLSKAQIEGEPHIPDTEHQECISLTAVGPHDSAFEVFRVERDEEGRAILMDDGPLELDFRGQFAELMRQGVLKNVATLN